MGKAMTRFLMLNYVNLAITHFEQSLNIVRPYISNEREKMIVSKYSQIDEREDYVLVMKNIEEIAKQNGVQLPDFSIW